MPDSERKPLDSCSLADSIDLESRAVTAECHLPHLIKNENVVDFRGQAFAWVKKYMGGPWSRAEMKHFRCKGMRGDLTNYLYICKLILWDGENDGLKILKSEAGYPTKITLKVYGEIESYMGFNKVEMMTLNVILAERHYIPRIFAIFPDGRFEQYEKSRQLRAAEIRKADVTNHLADYLAEYHKMDMPFGKTAGRLEETLDHYHAMALSTQFEDEAKSKLLRKIVRYNIDEELETLKEICFPCHDEVVFCHNNLGEGNLLLTGHKDDRRVQVVGCDMSSYNYRSYDFGHFFATMQFDFGTPNFPYFKRDRSFIPSEETRRDMVVRYVRRLDLPLAQQKVTEEKIMEYSEKFILAAHFLHGCWGIVQADVSELQFGYLEYALACFQAYFEHKILNNL